MNGSTTRWREKSKDTLEQMKCGNNNPKPVGHWESNPKREIHGIAGLSQKTRKNWNNLTLHFKELEKEQQTKPKVSRRREILKIRAEINKIKCKINSKKDQWNQEMVLWKDKEDWQTFIQTHQEKRERTQISTTRNERGEITMDTKEIQRIVNIYTPTNWTTWMKWINS